MGFPHDEKSIAINRPISNITLILFLHGAMNDYRFYFPYDKKYGIKNIMVTGEELSLFPTKTQEFVNPKQKSKSVSDIL